MHVRIFITPLMLSNTILCKALASYIPSLSPLCVCQVPNLVFLAVSPEEKESWINALNGAITRSKNSILDEVRHTPRCTSTLLLLFLSLL